LSCAKIYIIILSFDLEASTSTVNVDKLSLVTLVRQNFANQNITKLSDIEKHLTASSKI
jgi:hypothetical protein